MKRQNDQSRILFCAYGLVMISFFLPNLINSVMLLLFGSVSVYFIVKQQLFSFSKEGLITILMFLFLCVGLTYTKNWQEGIAIVERSLSFLMFPLLLSSSTLLSTKDQRQLLNVFIYASLIAALYCLGVTFYQYVESGTAYPTGQTGHFIYNRFMHHRLSTPLGMHAIYFSFYCAFAAISLLQQLLYDTGVKRFQVLWRAVAFFFLAGFLFLLKSSLFAFVFPLTCMILILIRFKGQLSKPRYVVIALLSGVFITWFSYEGIRSKLDSFETSFDYSDTSMRPLAMRIALWSSAWDAAQGNLLIGAGTGDAQDRLIQQYEKTEFRIAQEGNFNAHNMYLQYLLSNGMVMVLLLVLFLILLLFKSIRYRNYLFFSLVLYFLFFSMTESTLLKQKGIIFFMFFAFLFTTNPNCWKINSLEENEDITST